MSNEIINRVANSKLVTIDLEDYSPKGERILFDIKDWLLEGFVLREKDFRQKALGYNWEQYKKKSNISMEKAQEIEAHAAECNADPGEWRVSFEPVSKDNFLSIEVLDWDNQVWEDFMVAYEKTKKSLEDHHHE